MSVNLMGDGCKEHFVAVKCTQTTEPILVSTVEIDNTIQSSLSAIPFSIFPSIKAVTGELDLMQNAIKKLQESNENLVAENITLNKQLIIVLNQNSETNRVYNVQEEALRAQIASMQAQMAAQAAEAKAEEQRLHTLLVVAQREKTEAVAAVETVGEQQKAELNQQKRQLHTQVNFLVAEKTRLNAHVQSLSQECCVLKTQVSGEPLRKQETLCRIKASLDVTIESVRRQIEALARDTQRRIEAVHTGRHCGAEFGIHHLRYTHYDLSILSDRLKSGSTWYT